MEVEKNPISSLEIEREAEGKVAETFKEEFTRVQEKTPLFEDTARQYVQTFITDMIESVQPVYNSLRHGWNNFAPFRWFTYSLLIFYSISIAFFIGWAVALAGFFSFLGMSVFMPVVGILYIVAFAMIAIVTTAWIGTKFSIIVVYENFEASKEGN